MDTFLATQYDTLLDTKKGRTEFVSILDGLFYDLYLRPALEKNYSMEGITISRNIPVSVETDLCKSGSIQVLVNEFPVPDYGISRSLTRTVHTFPEKESLAVRYYDIKNDSKDGLDAYLTNIAERISSRIVSHFLSTHSHLTGHLTIQSEMWIDESHHHVGKAREETTLVLYNETWAKLVPNTV